MKKKLLLVLLLVSSTFCFAKVVSFRSFTKAADYIKSLKDNPNGHYSIKITADEKKENVVACDVLREALKDKKDIHVSLDLSNSKLEIGDRAFYDCHNLESITLPEDLKEIGGLAFVGCSLKSIYIPASVTSIGKGAFGFCDNLQTVNIDSKNKVYKNIDGIIYADKGKTIFLCPAKYPLKSFAVPSSVTRIEGCAFEDCTSLESVKLNEGLEEIGGMAFCGCTSLKTIEIPRSIVKIGDLAFGGTAITTIEIPSAVNFIGRGAFPETIKSITFKEKKGWHLYIDDNDTNTEISASDLEDPSAAATFYKSNRSKYTWGYYSWWH